jgi:hypothetical protein
MPDGPAFDAAVEAGIAAFLAGDEPPSDADVAQTLTGQGVEPWLVRRLVVFLPLAFGRRLLQDVTFDATFLDGPVTRPLADEPVFTMAIARAAVAHRGEVERIALRSSEFNAVNQALYGGSKLSDLVLGPVALAEPLPPAGTGTGGVPSPKEAFAAFLAGHGFPVEDGSRIGDFQFDARVFPHARPSGVLLQVDYEVRHPALATHRLLESFGGGGGTWHDAIGQTIQKFERASLHAIIATFLDRSACQDQVTWERYEHPSGQFELCLGSQLHLYSPGPPAEFGPVFDALLAALRDVALSPAVHALRVFTCHQEGALTTNEVLLDNEPWEAGQAVVTGAHWQVPGVMVGTRVFSLLVPTVPSSGR